MTPVCVSMPRSASRVTWQIVKEFSPPKPEWWDKNMSAKKSAGWHFPTTTETMSYPVRSHSHVSSSDPVVYTYRNPIEAYLSLSSRLQGTKQEENAVYEILKQRDVMSTLRRDEMKGRQVLWLKYEDYTELIDRIETIATFMNINISPSQTRDLVTKTNISINLKRSRLHNGAQDAFVKWEDKISGMQGNHINELTMGKAGAYIKLYPEKYSEIIQASSRTDFALIRSMAAELGY